LKPSAGARPGVDYPALQSPFIPCDIENVLEDAQFAIDGDRFDVAKAHGAIA
jgi:hypothetical protein